MVLPLLIGCLAGAASPDPGILFTSPRLGNSAGIRLEHQQNWERKRPVLGAAISAAWTPGSSLSVSALHRDLKAGPGREEQFDLVGAEAGWWPWRTDDGAPAELGIALMWTDSVFDVVRDSIHHQRSGERTFSFLLRSSRRLGWIEPGAGLLWTNRYFKGRHLRLDDFVAGLTARLHADAWRLSVLGEWCPWIANPDHRPVPWSVSLSFGRPPGSPLAIFATNTYSSTLANVTGTIPDVIWGVRISVGWEFLRPAD